MGSVYKANTYKTSEVAFLLIQAARASSLGTVMGKHPLVTNL
jgi:hypothetical protein